jgi:hypothetical protein
MRETCKWLPRAVVVVLAAVAPCSLMAQDSDLAIAAKKLMETAGGGKAAEIIKAARGLKDAGLPYQESLVAPQKGVIECKDRVDQLQVLLGIYLVDDVYAAAFGKREIETATLEFVRKDLVERLAVRAKIGPVVPEQASFQRFWEGDPTDQAHWDALFAEVQANHERMIIAAEKDPALMDFMVDRYFGAAVEWLYLSCKLSMGALTGKRLIPVFNAASARIDMVLPVLEALKDPYEQTVFVRSKRIDFLNACKEIIQRKGGNLSAEDMKDILKLVEPIRSAYLAKCS